MEDSITVEEALITEWTTAVEALDFDNIRELFDIRPELLWTPLTPLSHLETDFAHFIQRLKDHQSLGTSIRPVYALHHILYDYGVPNDEWAPERNELVEFILKHTKGNELNTCFWGSEQNTAMHLAFFNNQPELIQQLKEHGALSTIPNKSGHLPVVNQSEETNILDTDNSQPEVKLLINKTKAAALKDRPQQSASDRFKKLRELAESPNANSVKPLSERQNSTRRYFRPGHLEERRRRVLSEEEEAELKRQDSKRQREVAQLAQRSAVRNNPLFKKFEEQQQQQQQARRVPSISAASAVRERKKLLDAADQIRRSSRVINSLKDRSYVSTSVFRQAQETDVASKKKAVPTLAQLRAGTSAIKEVSPSTSDNEEDNENQIKLDTATTLQAPIEEKEQDEEIIKLNEKNNNSVTNTNTNVTSGNVPDSLLEEGDKLTTKPKKDFSTTTNLVNTKSNKTNIGVTENELESLSIGKLGDRGIQSNSTLNDKKTIDVSSSKVKDIVNVHEHLNDEEELEIYSVGKKFAVWKKDEVGQSEEKEGITSNIKNQTDNGSLEVDSAQGIDTSKSSTQFSLPTTKDTSTEKHTSDDHSTTNNGSSNKDFSNASPLTLVPPIEDESRKKSFDTAYTSKSDSNELNNVSPTNTRRPVIITKKQSPVESSSNKVLSTAKKLETTAEKVEVRNLKTFGTIKKAASSVTDLKSTFKNEMDTNTRNVNSAKSSFNTKDSPKISETEKSSLTVIDEAKVVERETSIDLTSKNHMDVNEPIGLVKQSTTTPKDTLTMKSADPTPLTEAAANDTLSSKKQSSEMLSKDKMDIATPLKKEHVSSLQSSHDVFNQRSEIDEGDDDNNTFSTISTPLGKEDSTTLEAKSNKQPSLFAVKEEKLDSIVSYGDENPSRNTIDEYSDDQKSTDEESTLRFNSTATKSNTNIPSIHETTSYTTPAVEAKNRLEPNHNVVEADMPLDTSTPTSMSLKNKTSQARNRNVPEFTINEGEYTTYNDIGSDSPYQPSHNANDALITDNSSAIYTDYYNDSLSPDSRLNIPDTQTKEKEANRILHLEINTNKSQMMIEDVDESDEDEASTPTMANPHTYQQQQQQQPRKKIVEDSDDEETRQEWKSAYDTLLSSQQEMDFEDDVLLHHKKTIAKQSYEDDSRLSMSSEVDEISILQTLSHQNEARVNNLTSKHEQAKKRQSGSQRNHWSTGIQHADILKRESLVSKGESIAASSEAGSEQWYDPDNDWTDQESNGRHSMLPTAAAAGANIFHGQDNDETVDYYYDQHRENSYRHSDSSINTNSETYSNKNSNSTENTNLDEDDEDERKQYQAVDDDNDYYSKYFQSSSTQNATKTRGESSYYNGGQSDNDQDEEGEIEIFMNKFSPPTDDKISGSRGVHSSIGQKSSEDITTSFFNNSSRPSLVEHQQQLPKPLKATTTTNFSSSTLSVNNIRGREDDEVSLIKVPSRTVAIAEAGVEQEVLPHDPNNPRVEDISHYMNKLPTYNRNDGGEAPAHGVSAFDAAAMSGSSVGGGRLENETVVIKRAISTSHSDGQPLELDRGIPHAHEIDSAFLKSERRLVGNEESQKISMSSMEANAFGKMYIAVSGAHNMLLPLPREITYVRCVISDGEYEYMSRYEILGPQILMDYECVIDTRPGMIITVSLHVRPDYHVKPRTGWTKWFTSIRKQKEHLSGYVHPEDGAIGQTRFAVDHMVPGCYKKTYEASFDCFNSWYARTQRERVRREQFGDEEDFLKIVGKLNVEMLYLPVSNPSVQVPRSLRECDLTLKIRQWHDTCWQSGYLSTRRQGTKIWERHYYRLIGSQLIGYTSDGSDRQVWDHYNISDVIRLSAAADKVLVTLMDDQEDDKVFPKESIHEQNHKGFFRLAFADYHLDCVSDDLEESEAWVKTLKSMIGRIPLRIHFSD